MAQSHVETRWIDLDLVDLAADSRPHDPAALEQLTRDMSQQGQLQEIIVEAKDGRFVVIAGVGRTLAAKKLAWQQIRASIREGITDFERARITFAENEDREDADAFYQASLIRKMMEVKNCSRNELGKELGISDSLVDAYIAVDGLPDAIRKIPRRLGIGQLTQIARLNSEKSQIAVARQTVDRDLSVRVLKALVDKKLTKAPGREPVPADPLRAELRALQTLLKFAPEGSWSFNFGGRRVKGSRKADFGWNFWVRADLKDPSKSLKQWFQQMAEGLDTTEAAHELAKPAAPRPKVGPDFSPGKINPDEIWVANTDAEVDQMLKENNSFRLPKNTQEETQLRKLAEQGPGPAYAWIFGEGGFYAKRASLVTWKQLGMSGPDQGIQKVVETLRAAENIDVDKFNRDLQSSINRLASPDQN